jgi:predicted HTH domain antitoxin
MSQLLLSIPDSAQQALHLSPVDLGRQVLLAAAAKFFEAGILSGGTAAELAGLTKPQFMERLAEFGVPVFNQSREDLADECSNA